MDYREHRDQQIVVLNFTHSFLVEIRIDQLSIKFIQFSKIVSVY